MICTCCNMEKGDDFRKNRTVCRECDNARERERRKLIKEANQEPIFKDCPKCGQLHVEFRPNRGSCKDCERAHGRNYRRNTDKAKIWAENNKPRMSELQHNWYERHKEEIKKKFSVRLKTDIKFKYAVNHRDSVRKFLKGNKNSKQLNCDASTFKTWLSFQFEDNMSFENYGSLWHLDHVIPIHRYLNGDYSSKIIFSWLNIKPVLRTVNLRKNKHIDKEQLEKHLIAIKSFFKIKKIIKPEEYEEYVKVLKTFTNKDCDPELEELLQDSDDEKEDSDEKKNITKQTNNEENLKLNREKKNSKKGVEVEDSKVEDSKEEVNENSQYANLIFIDDEEENNDIQQANLVFIEDNDNLEIDFSDCSEELLRELGINKSALKSKS